MIIAACAKVVTPTGGIKDITPPQIKSSKPENFSTNFKSKEITITFDEYIQLKDLNKNLIISPPLEEKPMIRVKGKSLIIRFESELKDSTTYNIYFGNALQDFNEGNPYKNFQYVFSTGDFVDSISITGKVLNAFDLIPAEDVFVMLYSNLTDSVPYRQIPEYISKTNKEGVFVINNIRNDKFKIFALKDANNNYRFDINNEEIAFIDSLVMFKLENITYKDTIFKSKPIDLTEPQSPGKLKTAVKREVDTIISHTYPGFKVNNYTLLLFTEDHKPQYLTNYTRDKKFNLEFVFNRPVKDSLIFHDLENQKIRFLKEISTKKDTFNYWLRDSMDYNKEYINCILSYQVLDSTEAYIWKTDSLKMKFEELQQTKKSDKIAESSSAMTLNVKDRTTFDLNKDIKILTTTPISSIDNSKIKFVSIADSVETIIPLKVKKTKLRECTISNELTEDTNYKLEILPGFIKDIYGTINDTLKTKFSTQKLDYYGKLLINISGIKNQKNIIVQLLVSDKKSETVVAEKHIKSDQIVEFDYLQPKEFIVKLIFDKNNNKTWDTGNYLKHKQPEEVIYYEKAVKIRSNWDFEISIDLNKRK